LTDRDFLDELVDERTARTPDFPAMVEAAERRRELLGALAERRREGEQSQTAVAAAMNSSQSSIARLETSATDARMSTLDRYARVLGYRLQYHLIPEAEAGPAVVVHGAEARPDQRETA
jgi:transcriptional regulator with XRE-family HTH domain